MNILEQMLGGGGGDVVGQLAKSFGLDEQGATAALSSLVPALAAGVSRNASAPGGLDALVGALTRGNHQRYLEDPSTLAHPETTQDGNGILGHIFGSKEVSRSVAQKASSTTGIGADVLKKMLPVVAGLVMAQLAKRHAAGPPAATASGSAEPSPGGGLLGGLTGLLDGDRDGDVGLDDLLGMAKKIL
jgi:hypothetical protein